ncbi:MAG: phage portal protein [Vicinamibacterales bacterium]
MIDQIRSLFSRWAPTAPPGNAAPAVHRIVARARPAYEGASTAPRAASMQDTNLGANVATMSAPTLRTRCRDAYRNDSWARAMVDTLVDDVIGWGIKPLSRAQDEPFRQAVQALWEDWSAVADADGMLDMAGLQAAAFREMVTGGECFIRLRRRQPGDGLPVPLQLQVLPAEICPAEYTQRAPGSGNEIRAGIEYDQIGRRVAYWMREADPGDDFSLASALGATLMHRVPVELVLHLFDPTRPGQRRGVPWLAPALVRLHELDKYSDATLLRLQIASMFAVFLKRDAPPTDLDAINTLTGQPVEDATAPAIEMQAGTAQELNPGEDVTFSDPPDPPAGFEQFVRHELRAAGAALGVPLEAFTHDWGATNDRLARVVLNQYRRRVHRILWALVVPQFLRPLWMTWFDLALAAGKLPSTTTPRPERVAFAPHAHAYVHPVQDVQSYREAIRSGLTSRAAAVAETGEDVEVIDAQNAADNTRADSLKLQYDSDGRQSKGGAR